MTQIALAEQIGITQSTLSRIEGGHKIDADTLMALFAWSNHKADRAFRELCEGEE